MTLECHGITATDGLVLAKTAAWHGLGTIVEEAPSPKEALVVAGLDWQVRLCKLRATFEGHNVPTDRFAVVREDTRTSLGVVGPKYEPLQNSDLADFCEALSQEGHAKVESAGSIHGGERVWFLLQAGSIDVRNNDTVKPYMLASSSHNGSTKLVIKMTSIRTVCRNTLNLALGNGKMHDAIVEVMHSGDMKKKLHACHEAVACFGEAVKFTGEKMKHLAEKAATVDDLQAFWAASYQRDFGVIPKDPVTTVEQRQVGRALDAFSFMKTRWDREKVVAGSTWWNILNSYTGFLQHDAKVRAKNGEERADKRVDQILFGIAGTRSSEALRQVLTLAG